MDVSEQAMIKTANRFNGQVKSKLAERQLTAREFAQSIGVTEASFTAAVKTYTMSKKSIEIRAMVRRLLDIKDQ